ncbi:venom carboxylesterase-6-like [Frankliniella occidentalis]|uniref:Carboxylic ester hydrolase n=2 Tax=Frankliniella occidentalis TaxID=133901 RepID=A0A9C6XC92_FRAOC|nr:venom carboxylesterase-6-like [Frankliniella occidentalis]
MGRSLAAVLLALAALALLAAVEADGVDGVAPPEVAVATGRLSGKWMSTRDGRAIAAFEGVPYAVPPLGELRFKRARPAEAWEGVRQAVRPGSMCVQRNLYFREEGIVGSEDCLYLNVYSPKVEHADPLPVLFWIHGGGWLSGAGDVYGPEYLLDQDVVLVTFNYRLGPLGLLSTGDRTVPGNNALKDMVLALRWVRDNVAAFGGDPASVTVFGESAGGASTHLMTLSPLAKGLFHRAMAMSGNSFTPWSFHSPGEARRQARVLATHTGCPESPSDALAECLRSKTAEEIISVDKRFVEWDIHPHMPFKATVESRAAEDDDDAPFMDMHPREAYAAGYLHQDVPFMTGITSHDGGVSVAVILGNETNLELLNERFVYLTNLIIGFGSYPEPLRVETLERVRHFYFGDGPIGKDAVFNIIDMATDAVFLYPTMQVIKQHKKHTKAPVYFYEFAHLSQSHRSFIVTFGAPSADYGVCHSDELQYLFPMTEVLPGELATDDVFVSRKFIEYIVRFARTGQPMPDRSWQEVRHPEAAEYMHIGSPGDIQMRANMAPKRMQLWSEVPIQIGRMPPAHDEL